MDTLWFFVTAPAQLMPILWPMFVLPVALGGLAAIFRTSVLRRVEPTRVHPIFRSRFWPIVVALGSFVLLWLSISLAMFVSILVAMGQA